MLQIRSGASNFVVSLRDLWARTQGDPQVCVAIIDGPVDVSHPSLFGANLSEVETLVSRRHLGGPAARHGTHVASVIFGDRASAVPGIAPQCRGLVVPIFADADSGSIAPCSQLDLARAILQSVEHGAHIVNISGGELADSRAAHPLLVQAVRHAVSQGVLIVAAAGNNGCGGARIPGSLPHVLAVVATDTSGERLGCRTDLGLSEERSILAPGRDILGAVPGAGADRMSGSSFATPIVSGIAALLLSVQIESGWRPDPLAVRTALLRAAWGDDRLSLTKSTSDLNDDRRGAGRLNINEAVHLIERGVCTMSDSIAGENGHNQVAEALALGGRALPIANGTQDTSSGENGSAAAAHGARTLPNIVAGSPSGSSASKELLDPRPSKSAGCGCGCSATTQLAYALGQLGYDFGTEARRDSIMQHMGSGANPHDCNQLLAYLQENPWDAAAVIWTLNLDSTPMYAIKPAGPFAREIYERLCSFLHQQVHEGVERVSVPGRVAGKATLMNGQAVPTIEPDLRGMYSWTTGALTQALCGSTSSKSSRNGQRQQAQKVQVVHNFLERVYHESRNLGMTSQDRAMNYAATNALNIERVYEAAIREEMDLDTIEVERSPVCRADSDCWDVKLHFFFPQRQVQTVRKVYRFTVDVSDVVPVMVGQMRSWFVR